MYKIKRYTPDDESRWDEFVEASKNGTFILKRDFMEYHSDRFTDHSLLLYDEKDKLCALLPANETIHEETRNDNPASKHLHSHQGLTYGGLILSTKQGANDVLIMFDDILSYLKENNFSAFHYKQIPTIYHRTPAQEDEYALWRHNATIEVINIASTAALHPALETKIERCRRDRFKQSCRYGFTLQETEDLSLFWPILEENLQRRYEAKPVHTLQEMTLLKAKFPQNIKCFLAIDSEDKPQGGALLFIDHDTVHVQYGHATEEGFAHHVMDFIYQSLLEIFRNDGRTLYFDFGTSNEDGGRVLNASLAKQKEGFGARGIAYKQWRIDIE